jgi:hypothetical protein
MIEHIIFGWSLGACSMLMMQEAYDWWSQYRKDLRLSRCECMEEKV